jgi:hypothetical protein
MSEPDIERGKLRITFAGIDHEVKCDVSRNSRFEADEIVIRFPKSEIAFDIVDGRPYQISLHTNAPRGYENVYVGRAYGGYGYRNPPKSSYPLDLVPRNWFITIPFVHFTTECEAKFVYDLPWPLPDEGVLRGGIKFMPMKVMR